MFDKKNLETIQKITKEFFQKMGCEAEAEVKNSDGKTLSVSVKMDDPKIYIGEGGKTLSEIQHLLKVILIKKFQSPFFLSLDINEYKKKKYQYLKELAKAVADEVALTKEEKILTPMSPAERRIVHLELAERKDVTSESMGEEPERRVLIRPYP